MYQEQNVTRGEKTGTQILMFLKEKRDGTIKARGCVDNRPKMHLNLLDYINDSPFLTLD